MKALAFSGGLDSTILYHYLNGEYEPCYVKTGAQYMKKEIEFCRAFQTDRKNIVVNFIDFISLEKYRKENSLFIPLRNLSIAMSIALEGYTEIAFGFLKNSYFSDCSEEFCYKTSNLLSLCLGKHIEILAPVINYSKKELVRLAIENSLLDIETIAKSPSCFSADPGQCGKCEGCYDKALAMSANGLDISFFEENPVDSELNRSFLGNLKKYSIEEQRDFLYFNLNNLTKERSS